MQTSGADPANNLIKNLNALSGLEELRSLNIRGNSIVDLTPLACLPRLGALNIAGNKVSSLEVLTRLPGLEEVRCDGNPCSDMLPPAMPSEMLDRVKSISEYPAPPPIVEEPDLFAGTRIHLERMKSNTLENAQNNILSNKS